MNLARNSLPFNLFTSLAKVLQKGYTVNFIIVVAGPSTTAIFYRKLLKGVTLSGFKLRTQLYTKLLQSFNTLLSLVTSSQYSDFINLMLINKIKLFKLKKACLKK